MPRILFYSILLIFSLPLFLFVIFWVQAWLAIPLVLALLVFLFRVESRDQWKPAKSRIRFFALLASSGLVLLLVHWGFGFTGAFLQHSDFTARNAQFGTICREEWPIYSDESHPFVYYFAGWLPSAGLSKIFGFEWRNHAQILVNSLFLWLSYIILCLRYQRLSIWPFLALVSLTGLIYIPEAVLEPFLGAEWSLKYSVMFNLRLDAPSILSQCKSSVNHGAIIALASALCLLRYKHPSIYVYIIACSLIYSPLAAIALMPIALYQIFRERFVSSILRLFKNSLTYLAIIVAGIAVVFYTQNSASETSFRLGVENIDPLVAKYFWLYWIASSIFWLILLAPANKKNALFWLCYAAFVLLPFVTYGSNYNELLFKGSLPYWMAFCLFFANIFKKKNLEGCKTWEKYTMRFSKLIALGCIFFWAINTVVYLPRFLSTYNKASNVRDPYHSDYYSPQARAVRESSNKYRDFGGMRDQKGSPIIPGILIAPK